MTSEKRGTRRRNSEALKTQLVAECNEPGASVAMVAISHGINANVLLRWWQMARNSKSPAPAMTGEFMALPLAVPPAALPVMPADIRVESRRGATMTTVTWPTSAAADFAVWIRELLR